MLDLTAVGKLTREKQEEIAVAYTLADSSVVLPEGGVTAFANKNEVVEFINQAAEKTGGFPHQLTEADFEANELYKTEDLKVGDYIILPWPTEEETARETMLKQLEDLVLDLPEEERANYLAESANLETAELAELINKLIADKEAKMNAGDTQEQEDESDVEEEEETAEEGGNDLETAIKSGKLRFENHLIIGVRTRIVSGRTKYELDATDGTSYLATPEELEEAVKRALA